MRGIIRTNVQQYQTCHKLMTHGVEMTVANFNDLLLITVSNRANVFVGLLPKQQMSVLYFSFMNERMNLLA